MFCYQMGSMHEALTLHTNYDDYLKEKHVQDCVSCKLINHVFSPWIIIFYLKEGLTDYGYADLGMRQTVPQKWMK